MNDPSSKRLANKVVIVTGAGTGIGEAAAHAFARDGARLALVGRREQPLAATADAVHAAGGEAMVVAGDVSDAEDVNAIITRTIDKFGRIDHVFNNAGIQGVGEPIVDMAEAAFDELIAINRPPRSAHRPIPPARRVSTP